MSRTARSDLANRVAAASAALLALSACAGPHRASRVVPSASPTTLQVRSVVLPGNSGPNALAFSADGTLWVTEGSGSAIGRVSPNGQLTQIKIPGQSNSPNDIVRGPDGDMWFTGFGLLDKVDSAGNLAEGRSESPGGSIGQPSHLTLGPDGAIWYTNARVPPEINRVFPNGENAGRALPASEAGLFFGGITTGADHALWFTASTPDLKRTSIGRLTTDGQYRSWKLPAGTGGGGITSGPDKALWFTENGGIGRIDVQGKISRFPLPTRDQPWRITTGNDQALWFTTDTGLGRITLTGKIDLWPVPGAKSLMGLAAANDGTLWLADMGASVLWQVTPPHRSEAPTPTSPSATATPTPSTLLPDGCPAKTGESQPVRPAGLATVDDAREPLDRKALPLIASVYCAAKHADYRQLARLYCSLGCELSSSDRRKQSAIWHRPGVLDEVVKVMQTHAAVTDGYTYPGFVLAGLRSPTDRADAAKLGFRPPSSAEAGSEGRSYPGVSVIFGEGEGGYSWSGVIYPNP